MRPQTHDWADEAAEHLMNFALDGLQENIALTLRDIRAQFEALVGCARAVVWFEFVDDDDDVKEAVQLLRNALAAYDTPAKPDPLRQRDSVASTGREEAK